MKLRKYVPMKYYVQVCLSNVEILCVSLREMRA